MRASVTMYTRGEDNQPFVRPEFAHIRDAICRTTVTPVLRLLGIDEAKTVIKTSTGMMPVFELEVSDQDDQVSKEIADITKHLLTTTVLPVMGMFGIGRIRVEMTDEEREETRQFWAWAAEDSEDPAEAAEAPAGDVGPTGLIGDEGPEGPEEVTGE